MATQDGLDRIIFDATLSGSTILTTATLGIDDEELIIDGTTLASPVTLSGGDLHAIFRIQGQAITLRDLQLTHGSGDDGGAIEASDLDGLHVADCVIHDNQANEGGGLYAIDVTNLHVEGTAFRDNESTGIGGAISLRSCTGQITGCRILSNAAARDGGGIYVYRGDMKIAATSFEDNTSAGNGGAITGNLRLSCADCLFFRNEALSGGAISLLDVRHGLVSDCLFEANRAIGTSGREGSGGGAVYCLCQPPTPYLVRSTFLANTSAAYGGAVFASSQARIRARNCTFVDNTAAVAGGAAGIYRPSSRNNLVIEHCTATGNQARDGGGFSDYVTLINCIVAGNEATRVGDDLSRITTLQGCNFIGSNDGTTQTTSPTPGFKNSNGHFVGTPQAPFDPGLAPLGLYGTAVPVRPPLPGSTVIDSAQASRSPDDDQLGHARPIGPEADIGAVEAFAFSLLPLIDTDGDGIDDRLEPAYEFVVGDDDSGVDRDGDGSTDGEELANMTAPGDPLDFFHILSLTPVTDDPNAPLLDLMWSAFPGLHYEVLRSSDLDFTDAMIIPAGRADAYTHDILVPRPDPEAYYQVRRR